MSVINGEKRNKNQNFDEKHRFVKGNDAAKGERKRSDTEKLRFALKKAGVKRKEDFWDAVAEAAFDNREIMKTVVNKLVPTVSELTGLGGEPIRNIILNEHIYPKEEKESKSGEAKT